MRHTLYRHPDSSASYLLIFLLALVEAAAAYMYFWMHKPTLAIALASSGFLIALIAAFIVPIGRPRLIIDELGIYDEDLGVGKIEWSDVTDVHIEYSYGTRFLCLRVKNPGLYLARLDDQRKKKVLFHRSLGFHGFNIDVRGLRTNLIDLKNRVEKQVALHQR
jgi:hypothetical protein